MGLDRSKGIRQGVRPVDRLAPLLACLIALPAVAQKGSSAEVAIFNEATAVPFTRFITVPVHPGLQVGARRDIAAGDHHRVPVGVHLGYFHHAHLAQGFYVGGDLGYEWRAGFGVSLAATLGVAYLRTYTTGPEFQFKNGAYIRRPDKGNGRVMPSLSFDAGYHLGGEPRRTQLFLRYRSWIEYPYSPGFIEVMSHIDLHVGVRIPIHPTERTP